MEKTFDDEQAKNLAISDIGLTEDEAEMAVENFEPKTQDELIEELWEKKNAWLEDHGTDYKHVLEDDDGEYIMQEPTLMDEGENEDTRFKKVYLPQFN